MGKSLLKGKHLKWLGIKGSLIKGEESKINKRLKQASLRYLLPLNKMFHSNKELNIDLGGWVSNAKVMVLVTKIVKIQGQKDKLLKAFQDPPSSSSVSKSN